MNRYTDIYIDFICAATTRLENQTSYIDKVEISLEPIERLLGILSEIVQNS